jgi:chorismate dehydratase
MNTYRITAVSYYNTLPLIYGLLESRKLNNFRLELAVPSDCAKQLLHGHADISLVPVGALPDFNSYETVGSHCIGANGDVKTVLLLSNKPIEQLQTIYLDTDSRTSVKLVKVLSIHHWKKQFIWGSLGGMNPLSLEANAGVVLIGDKTFRMRPHFNFVYDLAGEWFKFTGLPFVFAAWVSTVKLPDPFICQLEEALSWGVEHARDAVKLAKNLAISVEELVNYLENDISFDLDNAKREGMNLFLKYLGEMGE